MNYVWIDEENVDSFLNVLPRDLILADSHICVGITDDEDYVCGAICYRYTLYQYDVLWLYVIKERRRQGFGTALMDIVFKVVGRSGEIYPISAYFEAEDDESLYPFFISYEKMDVSYSHDRYILSPKDIYRALIPPKAAEQTMEQTFFFSLPGSLQKNMLEMLRKDEGYAPDDYESWKETIVPELCKCIIKNEELKVLVFVHKRLGGDLELSYLYSKNPMGLAEILMSTAWDIEEKYPEARLYFDAISEEAALLAKKIFPKINVIPVYEAEW